MAGRPRKKIHEDDLRLALESGLTYAEIGERFEISERTITRRVEEARKAHGSSWGQPRLVDSTKALGTIDQPDDVSISELHRLARNALARALVSTNPNVACQASKIVLALDVPAEQPRPDRAELIEKIRQTIANAGPPSPANRNAAIKLET